MKTSILAILLVLISFSTDAYSLPSLKVPDGLGVNIHFTGEPAQDLDMIQKAGFRFIRMDFAWSAIEKTKGQYDFTEYDQLMDGLQKRNIRPIFILDYSNNLYEKNRSIQTDDGRMAFAKYAAEAAKRYAGRGVLWELWNEPNISFWEPQPSIEAYMKLAKLTFPKIKEADKNAICIAPATSTVDLKFLEDCFKRGLLEMVDAVSIHPYRQNNPESVESEIRKLRCLISKYSPEKPDIPIISDEWGYSTAWLSYNDEIQGKYLPRQFLTNLYLGIPVSIWYDWHDDGPDPKEPEHRFGTVTQDYKPKPSYLAMQKLAKELNGLSFIKRLVTPDDMFYNVFSDGKKFVIAAWTTGGKHYFKLSDEETLQISDEPRYINIPIDDKPTIAEASWCARPKTTGVMASTPKFHSLSPMMTIEIINPFAKKITVKFTSDDGDGIKGKFNGNPSFSVEPGKRKFITWNGIITRFDLPEYAVSINADIDGMNSTQKIIYNTIDKQEAELIYLPDGNPAVKMTIPEMNNFNGDLVISENNSKYKQIYNLFLSPETTKIKVSHKRNNQLLKHFISYNNIIIPLSEKLKDNKTYSLRYMSGKDIVVDKNNQNIKNLHIKSVDLTAFNDGDSNVKAEYKIIDDKSVYNSKSISTLKFDYKYEKGWKFVRLATKKTMQINGKPKALGLWIKGDGSESSIRTRFVDATGRYFQADFGRADKKDWTFMKAALNDPSVGSWGDKGSPDKIVYPIKIDTLILVDSKRDPIEGSIEFAGLQLIY